MEYNRRPSRTAAAAALRPPGRADCQRDPFFRTDRVLSLRPTAAPRQAPPSSPRRRRALPLLAPAHESTEPCTGRDDAGAELLIKPETARVCGTASLLGAPGQWGSRSGRGQCGVATIGIQSAPGARGKVAGAGHDASRRRRHTPGGRRRAGHRDQISGRTLDQSHRIEVEANQDGPDRDAGILNCGDDRVPLDTVSARATLSVILPYPGRHCDCVSLPAAQFGII
jgi:hypothetical protein